VMDYPYAKFGDFCFSRFGFFLRTNKQTNKHSHTHTEGITHRRSLSLYSRDSHRRQLDDGHSVECITHAVHSIAFLHFVTLTFDLLT